MFDLNDLKKAFEREEQKAEETTIEKERQLLKDVTIYLCDKKGVSAVKGYEPDEITEFLLTPVSEIKQCIGYADMNDDELEGLAYTLRKKIQKSGSIINW